MAEKDHEVPTYLPSPQDWAVHPRKKMLMTPWLVFFGGIFAFGVPTLVAAFFHMMFFHPPVSNEWSPITAAGLRGRHTYVANGCVYCHSGYTRPRDVRQGLYYLYPRISLPGDFVTTDSSPNVWGTARIGPDLSQESGYHPPDWERAHFNDPRFVTPNSIMPRFSFLRDKEVDDLTTLLEEWSGKSGVLRAAGQTYMKRLFLTANNLPTPPRGFQGAKLTMADVYRMQQNAPNPLPGTVDGLGWSDIVNLNVVDRSYWLSGDPMPVTTNNLLRGRLLFQDMCIGCHGQGGSGVSEAARFLRPMPASFMDPGDAAGGPDTSPGDFYYRILRGIHGTAMENFGTRLKVEDIWKIVLFLKTIPNGGLQYDTMPTPEMYIEWSPPPELLTYVAKHPISANKEFMRKGPPKDPFELEAERVLAGLNQTDRFNMPKIGELSLKAAARELRTIYDKQLDQAYRDYRKRGGSPTPPQGQRQAQPELLREWR